MNALMLHVQDKYGLWLANILKLKCILVSILASYSFILLSSKPQMFSSTYLDACTRLYSLMIAVCPQAVYYREYPFHLTYFISSLRLIT